MKTKKQSNSLDLLHIIRLVFADLCFEWVLSLCMVLALGAVFAPLFILLGLQSGIIGNMLDNLQKDPVSRLVMPKWETSLDDAWLASLRKQTSALIESPTAFLLLDVEVHEAGLVGLCSGRNGCPHRCCIDDQPHDCCHEDATLAGHSAPPFLCTPPCGVITRTAR